MLIFVIDLVSVNPSNFTTGRQILKVWRWHFFIKQWLNLPVCTKVAGILHGGDIFFQTVTETGV